MTVRPASVSLCMIVRDEEHNLAECLRPVAALFDQIVIVDTGSRDGTREIARQFTSHIYDFEWCEDFAAARNESLRHATGDWIFWLDADDRLRPEHVARLKTLLDALAERPLVFLMDTVLLPANANEERSLVTHQRLFRRHPKLHWQGRVHEQLAPEAFTLGYEYEFCDIEIDHVGYQQKSLAETKARRKLRLLRMDYAVDPDNPSTLLHLGMALRRLGSGAESRKHLLRLVEMGFGAGACMRWVYDALADLAMNNGQPTEAVVWAARGLSLFPGDENLLLAKSLGHYALEEYDAAGRTLQEIINLNPNRHMKFGAVGDVQHKLAPQMLGAVLRMQRSYDAAAAMLEAVLARYPDDIHSLYNLGLVHLDCGDAQKLAPVVRQLLAISENVGAGLLMALWHMRYGDLSLAGPIIDGLIEQAPQAPRPRMLRVEWLSRSKTSLEVQLRALRDVLRVQPSNMETRMWIEKIERFQAAAAPAATNSWSTSMVMPGVAVG